MPPARPSREDLGGALRRHRDAAGLSTSEAGKRARFSQSKVSRMETGRNVPTLADVEALADVYELAGPERDELLAMVTGVRELNRRLVINRDPAAVQDRVAKLERDSGHVAGFQPAAVPGLLQAPGYARAIFESGGFPPEQVELGVLGRARRQEEARQGTTQHTVLLAAGAFDWQIGGAATMAEQINRVHDALTWPNFRIGYIPADRGVDVLPLHGFDIYDSPPSVMVGLWTATAMFEEPGDVEEYRALFERLSAFADWGEDARATLPRRI
ncbi:helix-turn-helix domain-containing protein [Pseudonocardia sp. T1-2H]|uniref:helix-turn-helix domain-containing protein n=1 Tax=Pseudonocardia sp. T1-2H TaxID=3128899 RepID=UPI003100CE40